MFHAISAANVIQGTDEWRAARKNGIGGSDAAAVLGLDEYSTPLQKWQEKLGLADDFEGNWFSRRGTAMEPVIRQEYANKTGRTIHIPEHILCHPVHRFMLSSIDGFSDDGRLQEFKTATSRKGWGEPGTDEIPQAYLVQAQHNLIVSGAEVIDVGVSIAGLPPEFYEVPADHELQEMIIEVENDFWQKVQARIEPEPATIEEMIKRNGIRPGAEVIATDEIMHHLADLIGARDERKKLEAAEDYLKDAIKLFMAQNSATALISPQGQLLVTWNEGKGRSSLDSAGLRRDYPDIANQYSKTGNPVRTFLIK